MLSISANFPSTLCYNPSSAWLASIKVDMVVSSYRYNRHGMLCNAMEKGVTNGRVENDRGRSIAADAGY